MTFVARIPIVEIFGPTIQGEGMMIGKKTMFVRTGGCDYKCSWCDSAFTWNGSQKPTMMTPQEIVDRLFELGKDLFQHVTISGGNPALIGTVMRDLIMLLHGRGIRVGAETQGSRWQDWFLRIDDLTISPKPPSSKMDTNWDTLDFIIHKLEDACAIAQEPYNFSLKVVVFNDRDFEYARTVHKRYPDVPFYLSVGNDDIISQENISNRLLKQLDWLVTKVMQDPYMNDAITLPQLHALLWGNKRGV